MNETAHSADGRRGETTASLAPWLWGALALALAACAMLWMRFGPQVFLDAATAAWKSCF